MKPLATCSTSFQLWRFALTAMLVSTLLPGLNTAGKAQAEEQKKHPNIVFIMADDLGYGELGCFGQKLIQTPHLDKMAQQGMRFSQFYAGSTVCAPSRSVLMTGQHMGHTHVRGNAGSNVAIQTLRASDVTVAEVAKQAGYQTALCGKWGLGDAKPGGESGLPNKQGFDHFFGYLNQVHAHNYYPEFLWRNTKKVALRNVVKRNDRTYGGFRGGYATKRVDYSHDLVMNDALEFVKANHSSPFFLYIALTVPHANNEGSRMTGDGQEVPDYGIYKNKKWPKQDKGQAAMITRMDSDIGRLFALLEKLEIDNNTLVIFTSDNGPHNEGGHNPSRFNPGGPLRGMKRDLYEGGIRMPTIARWPGVTPAGSISRHIGYFGDLMATVAELTGQKELTGVDSISFAPTLRGDSKSQKEHEYLYWEFYERGSKQAVRSGKWKAIRMPMLTGKTQLFDLSQDLGEANDVSASHPDVVQKLEAMMNQAHTPHPSWKPSGKLSKNQPAPGHGKAPF